MRVLVTNDDGIDSVGIRVLAELAKTLGEVWVVAPKSQCSAMSHRITVLQPLTARREAFPVEGIEGAFSVSGTPADCVKTAVDVLLPCKPELVLSGINNGYNVGLEILYSGTVGAAMEGLIQGIPSVALSSDFHSDLAAARVHFQPVMERILKTPLEPGEIWNVNFPACPPEEVAGVAWECEPADRGIFMDGYTRTEVAPDEWVLDSKELFNESAPAGSDLDAVMHNRISVCRLRNMVLCR